MTARHAYDPAAGQWVAWFTEPSPVNGQPRKVYLRDRIGDSDRWHSMTIFPIDAVRFDTKDEARRAVLAHVGGRMPAGLCKAASRITDEVTE